MDEIDAFMAENNEELHYGFVASSSNAMSIKTKVKITEANLPDVAAMEADPFTEDKFCLICPEQGMALSDLNMHLAIDHEITIDAPSLSG